MFSVAVRYKGASLDWSLGILGLDGPREVAMPLYGVQYYWDCEEHGLSCSQQTFESRDDALARRAFYRRVVGIRKEAKKPNSPAIAGGIRLFRLNERADQGTLLMTVSAT